MNELKVGDIVKLISGGPEMTVTYIGEDSVSAHWFGKHDEKPLWDRFPREALQKVQRTN